MFYTYVLKSLVDAKWYIGHSEDPDKRLVEHNSGKVFSTKSRRPFVIIYKKEFVTRSLARWQEKKWKSSAGHEALKKLVGTNSNCSL